MEFFDTHSHYNDEKFNEDRDQIIEETYRSGITKFICAGYNIPSSIQSLEISKKYEFIYSICGISPNDIPQSEEELWKDIAEISRIVADNKEKKLVAIGEIGLDYYWNKENKELQQQAFVKQIELANKLELPIVIHSRDASVDTIQILKENPVSKKGIFHCCQLNQEMIRQALELGFYISFAGPITFKNSKNAEDVVKMVPMDKILIETDSPYLSPEPNRGKRNDSRNVKIVAQKIADFKNITIEEVAKITYENAMKIFEIWQKGENKMYDNWEQWEAETKQCKKCRLYQTRNNVVFGVGNKEAKLMFIGEGPGADEDIQGEPFVGKAGKLMNMAFEAIGLKREDVYIANVVKCRPPSNRNPEDDEAAACLNYLRNQVILVKPQIIVLLGSVALKNILGKEYGITASRGKWVEKKGILYMPTWHPAALLRDETKKIDFIKDLKLVMEKMKEWNM